MSELQEPEKNSAGKWLENLWYHYKFHICMAAVAIVTLIICVTQLVTKDKSDYYVIYAGPQLMAYQDVKYLERAVSKQGVDRTGDGKVTVTLKDIMMLSAEELEKAKASGAKFDSNFLQTTMNEFYQQMFTGDSVLCILSPYMYEKVNEEGGFLPLSEIFDEIPESAYDDCGIVLSKTAFGASLNSELLPEDSIICMRRISTMSAFSGKKKSEKEQKAYIELFRNIIEYTPETETSSEDE